MAVKMVSVKCPECGASLNIEENREKAFCTYCGAQILLYNENEHIYRHVDEAEVTSAETDRIIRLKQIEIMEKDLKKREEIRSWKFKIGMSTAIIGFLLIPIGYFAGHFSGDSNSPLFYLSWLGIIIFYIGYRTLKNLSEEDDVSSYFSEKVKVPSNIIDYNSKSYKAVETMFLSAGFTNVKCIALNDLRIGVLHKPGMVESITINGQRVISGGKSYPKDAPVIISYHSMN